MLFAYSLDDLMLRTDQQRPAPEYPLVAAVPFVGAVLAKVTGHEVLESRRVAGLLIGLAGVAALVGFDVGSANASAVLAVAVVVVCYAVGPIIVARYLSEVNCRGSVWLHARCWSQRCSTHRSVWPSGRRLYSLTAGWR